MSKGKILNQDDEYFIMANWESMSNLEMAKKLGVNQETVSRRGSKLGLINKKGVASGNYKRTEISEQISEYVDSLETIQESEGRKRTLELDEIKRLLHENNKLKLKIKGDTEKTEARIIRGTVLQKNDNFIALKLKNYVECFGYSDFLIGRAVIM